MQKRMIPVLGLFIAASISPIDAAHARGGGPNVTESYGYQRRLQESQGLVTMRSSPVAAKPVVPPKKKHRHHG